MAVDTRNKRASILGLALASAIVFPNPDGTIDNPDRQQTAYSYSGISSIPVVPTTGFFATLQFMTDSDIAVSAFMTDADVAVKESLDGVKL